MLFARIPLPYLPALVNWDTMEMEKTAQVNITFISLVCFICEVKTLRSRFGHVTENGRDLRLAGLCHPVCPYLRLIAGVSLRLPCLFSFIHFLFF